MILLVAFDQVSLSFSLTHALLLCVWRVVDEYCQFSDK